MAAMASTTVSAALVLRGFTSIPCHHHRVPSSLLPFCFGLINPSSASSSAGPLSAAASVRVNCHHYSSRPRSDWSTNLGNTSRLLLSARSAQLLESKPSRGLYVRRLNYRRRAAFHAAASARTTTEALVSECSSATTAATTQAVERPTWRASIDFKWIRENKDEIAENIINRKSSGDVEAVVKLYEQYVRLSMEVDMLRAERNSVASSMKGKIEKAKREELISRGKELKDQLAGMEQELDGISDNLQREGQRIPNMTHPSVPLGSEEQANVRKLIGSQREFSFPIKDHVDIALALDLVDFEAAAEVSGNKFYYLKNEAVLLELALINWTLSQLSSKGFTLLSTPDLVRSTVVEKCGFQPRGQNTQVYSIEGTDLCLAGTSEIPVGGLYMNSMLAEESLPLKLVALSHCFRTEAGAAGSTTRGLYRVHQFSKVEMFGICRPEESEALHEELITIEEDLYTSLGLHFKTLDMSSEDLGAPAYRKYDVEAWMPGLGRYGEISSASNCTDYQARRLNIRYRPAGTLQDGPKTKLPSPRFAHTLNATACAVPRMIIAILENNQQADGSVNIPDVLQPFMGGLKVISRKSR